jgi:hypothetical protein
MRVSVLDWHQHPSDRARTFISAGDAERLVKRLAAEEIRPGKMIRMFSPDSVFYALRPVSPQIRYIPAKLSSGNIGGTRFRQPSDPAWQETHRAAIRSVQIRSYMTYKGWFEQFKSAIPA